MTAPRSARRREPKPKPGGRFVALRQSILADDRRSAHERRIALTNLADAWLARFFQRATADARSEIALVAVGGYGRRELLPGSDLDVLLLLGDARIDPAAIAEQVFYPVWDAGIALDHSVRTHKEALAVADDDIKVTLGLMDARHVAGTEELTQRLRADVLQAWRRRAGSRLPELADMAHERAARVGELAHLLEPDLVEARGGLRDSLTLRAVAASWVADQPHTAGVDEAREWLLAVRDALHRATRRRHDRLVFEDQADVAARLGLVGPDALLRRVAEAGRRIAYASDVTWRSVDRAIAARKPLHKRLVKRRPLADSVVEHLGEAVLAHDVRPDQDAVLALRAAAAAAQNGLPLGPPTVVRLARECPPLPTPWPDTARDALISLLGAGHDAISVWDSLDAAGLIVRWFPEWEAVRYLHTRTPVHRHTVDRHLTETAAVAAALTRRVARPDLLLLAALVHDLGKGVGGDHSVTGATIARELGRRIGLTAEDSDTLARLVRYHLLLPETATRRDPSDPATLRTVVDAVENREFLELLAALTEADATAAGPIAWSPMRASLVNDLVARTRAELDGAPAPKPGALQPWQIELARQGRLEVRVNGGEDGHCRVTVAAPDAAGLLGTVAGVLALHQLDVRTATTHTVHNAAVQVWNTLTRYGAPPDENRLRHDIDRALKGGMDVAGRLKSRADGGRRVIRHADPQVEVLPDVSADATVLEVRAHDEPALLHSVASAIARSGAIIRSAVVETLGSEAIDVFYLVDDQAQPLDRERTGGVVTAATRALAAVTSAESAP